MGLKTPDDEYRTMKSYSIRNETESANITTVIT